MANLFRSRLVLNVLLMALLSSPFLAAAQEIRFADSARIFNTRRIIVNYNGTLAAGSWGLASVAAGAVGMATAKQENWKAFHATNLAFGASEMLFSGVSLLSCRSQIKKHPETQEAYRLFKRARSTHLYGICADVACVAIGEYVIAKAKDVPATEARNRGIGQAMVLQGVGMLIFDNIMYRVHSRYNSRWGDLMDNFNFIGSGIGFNYTIPLKKRVAVNSPQYQY